MDVLEKVLLIVVWWIALHCILYSNKYYRKVPVHLIISRQLTHNNSEFIVERGPSMQGIKSN